MPLAERFTIDLNDGDMVGTVHVAQGPFGWGADRIEIKMRTPVRPEDLAKFMKAYGDMLVTGGLVELVWRHDVESSTGGGADG